jgi:hypothetical protein
MSVHWKNDEAEREKITYNDEVIEPVAASR